MELIKKGNTKWCQLAFVEAIFLPFIICSKDFALLTLVIALNKHTKHKKPIEYENYDLNIGSCTGDAACQCPT